MPCTIKTASKNRESPLAMVPQMSDPSLQLRWLALASSVVVGADAHAELDRLARSV